LINRVKIVILTLLWMPCASMAQTLPPDNPSLQEKASHFEKIIRERHVKHGFVRELKGGFLHSSDNDGLWTALYVTAMSFKYAATKDPKARQWARESFRSLEWLEKITGKPGFPARSIVKVGEPKKHGYDGEWHVDASGKWEWKGDTSSDELDGHFLAYSVFYDLVADGPEKMRVQRLVRRVMDTIIENDWYLVDLDGKPTRWGVWNPKQLNDGQPVHGLQDEDWSQERGLNSLEILSHLKAAHHITGDPKYQTKYMELVEKHRYAENVRNGVIDPADLNHSDVELAFCAFYPLLKYEADPALLSIYRESLRKTWEIVKPVKSPWWNFTQCIFNGEDCGLEEGIKTLEKMSWKQINLPGGVEESGIYTHTLLRWNGNPYRPNPGNGDIEGDGVVFLLPYWMGRYHGQLTVSSGADATH